MSASAEVEIVIPADHRVLIVGGAGFIGHHLALALHERGATALVIDDLSVNHLNAHQEMSRPGVNRPLYTAIAQARLDLLADEGIEVRHQSGRDVNQLSETLSEFAPHTVVQLAAISHASRSNADPHRAYQNGMETLEATLEAIRRHPGSHLVYTSSSMVYGNFATPVVDEEAPCDPLGIYGALKFGGEVLIRAHSRVSGLEHTIVRPSAAYGPRCLGRRFIQTSIENAIAGMPLQVTGDGQELVDFTYIDDLVQGLLRVIAVPDARGEIINITTGKAASLLEAAEIVMRRFEGSRLEHLPRSAAVPKRGTLDISKAQDLLGYQPRFTIETGVNATVDWYTELSRQRPELFEIGAPIVNE